MYTVMSACRHHLGEEGVPSRLGWLLVNDAMEVAKPGRRLAALAGMHNEGWYHMAMLPDNLRLLLVC